MPDKPRVKGLGVIRPAANQPAKVHQAMPPVSIAEGSIGIRCLYHGYICVWADIVKDNVPPDEVRAIVFDSDPGSDPAVPPTAALGVFGNYAGPPAHNFEWDRVFNAAADPSPGHNDWLVVEAKWNSPASTQKIVVPFKGVDGQGKTDCEP